MNALRLLLALTFLAAFAACDRPKGDTAPADKPAGKTVLRVGHFPNITHAQAVIASELSHQGKGFFEARLGPDVDLQWFVYNAGPSAMEAIFTDSIDMSYVGTGPMLNAYSKSKGEEIRLVAGSAVGGAALIVQGDGRIGKPEDFRGKKIAIPQIGNTQDIALRIWLKQHGFKVTQLGGDAQIVPTENPDQLGLFQAGSIDAVWTVEPWVSRLELEGKGQLFLEEKEAITTVLVSSVKALKNKQDAVQKFVKAHGEFTAWVNEHPEEAKALFVSGMKTITKRDLSSDLVNHAWPRLKFTKDIEQAALDKLVADSQTVDFLKGVPALDRLMALPK